jgi:hypothetical protein
VVGDKKLTNLELINDFIHKRSAHVTQNTLYGYLQTRIGGNYIKAFKDENYLKSINISRWNIFVISVQDISFYIFSYLYKNQNYQKFEEAKKIYHKILLSEKKNGLTDDIYDNAVEEFDKRFQELNWATFCNSNPFDKSSQALIYWSPIADELKNLDKEIVVNSMINKWNNVCRDFEKLIQKID